MSWQIRRPMLVIENNGYRITHPFQLICRKNKYGAKYFYLSIPAQYSHEDKEEILLWKTPSKIYLKREGDNYCLYTASKKAQYTGHSPRKAFAHELLQKLREQFDFSAFLPVRFPKSSYSINVITEAALHLGISEKQLPEFMDHCLQYKLLHYDENIDVISLMRQVASQVEPQTGGLKLLLALDLRDVSADEAVLLKYLPRFYDIADARLYYNCVRKAPNKQLVDLLESIVEVASYCTIVRAKYLLANLQAHIEGAKRPQEGKLLKMSRPELVFESNRYVVTQPFYLECRNGKYGKRYVALTIPSQYCLKDFNVIPLGEHRLLRKENDKYVLYTVTSEQKHMSGTFISVPTSILNELREYFDFSDFLPYLPTTTGLENVYRQALFYLGISEKDSAKLIPQLLVREVDYSNQERAVLECIKTIGQLVEPVTGGFEILLVTKLDDLDTNQLSLMKFLPVFTDRTDAVLYRDYICHNSQKALQMSILLQRMVPIPYFTVKNSFKFLSWLQNYVDKQNNTT